MIAQHLIRLNLFIVVPQVDEGGGGRGEEKRKRRRTTRSYPIPRAQQHPARVHDHVSRRWVFARPAALKRAFGGDKLARPRRGDKVQAARHAEDAEAKLEVCDVRDTFAVALYAR